ncbi:hypothetical protein G113_20012 [Aeromonas molluscorum 848]|uniref:Uncharacterized protein n=1 Tax=Aeromonas molluscorum 848 TaxID=1268236 RepID=R1GNU6_9GAMM|nr:hypothetical protein G113_20012 [Aeromonas molluscorum 848]
MRGFACQFLQARLPPLSSSPQFAAFTREIATIAAMTLSPEVDCRLAIIRGLIEAWEEAVDKNLNRFNQLAGNRCFE